MDSEFQSILTPAATEAEGHVGESFTGPDGAIYIGTFRGAEAFELAAAGLGMDANGYPNKTTLAMTSSKAQYTAPPWSWRQNKTPLIRSNPFQKCTVAAMTDDDPLFYFFILLHHQPQS